MIKLKDTDLSTPALQTLAKYQAKIDAHPIYADRVREAKKRWDVLDRNTKAFREVKGKLVAMCPPIEHCCYCEDGKADEIEHFRPKSLYPDLTFAWSNYLLACSTCNSTSKKDKFAVIDAQGELQHLIYTGDEPFLGQPALINPRYENPLDFMRLEFREFTLVPYLGNIRAIYTIETLQLNKRIELIRWRKRAFNSFIRWLELYPIYVARGEIAEQMINLSEYEHLSVWEEMRRIYQDERFNELKLTNPNLQKIDTGFSKAQDALAITFIPQ